MDKYLKYQEIDSKLYKIEGELMKSDCFKLYAQSSNTVKLASEKLTKLEEESGTLSATLDRLNANLSAVSAELEELQKAIVGVNELKEIEYYQKNIDKLLASIESIEREINKTMKDISEKGEAFNSLMEIGKNATKTKKEAAESCRVLKESKQGEINELKAQLAELVKDLNPDVIERYNLLRNQKKMPVFVPLKDKVCSGCGMELAFDTLSKLKAEGDHVECPNCQRFLYVESK